MKELSIVKQMVADGQISQDVAEKYFPGLKEFEVGDIITNGIIIGKVDENNNNKYHGWFGYNKDRDTHYADIPDVKDWHKWTIQDAKDGDAVCYKDEISLYKHDIKNCTKQETIFGGFVYHCCYDGKRFIMDSFYSLTEQDKTDIHPATKEQRDLLFSKMKEAGYEWDEENKELKKIEQATAWSEEDEDEDVINKAESWLDTLCDYLKDSSSECIPDIKDVVNKLKSLRLQNHWKPSDLQMASITCAVRKMKKSACYDSELVSLLNDLKKLKGE